MSKTKKVDTVEPEANEAETFNYYKERCKYSESLDRSVAYPHKFACSISIPQFIEKYDYLSVEERLNDVTETVAGRVMRIAGSSNKLAFFDLVMDGKKLQVFADAREFNHGVEAFIDVKNKIHRGDIIGITGIPARTKRGELSIYLKDVAILSHCLHMLPKPQYGLKDPEVRFRKRYLDLIINTSVRDSFVIRSKVLQHIRKYLTEREFLEVETPLMNQIPGGANAKPFVTYHNYLNLQLYMRIAPELYLKQLVIGGLSRVFEIGKNFRNEAIDLTHNPEFTAVEFYMAFADVHDMLKMTEDMVSTLVKEVTGSYVITYNPEGLEKPAVEIDFTPPWKTLSFVGEIEKQINAAIPRPLESDEAVNFMINVCNKYDIELPSPATSCKLLDKLCAHFVESQCHNPTFIIDHPQLMSPLAKWHRSNSEFAERGELFVLGRELANFYTELNDPKTQYECFLKQAQDKAKGDDEACFMDKDYCVALEYGLPPTGGWGLGIDRLIMFLSNHYNIKEVIAFPAMRPIKKNLAAPEQA
ncbi:uncharacterized protein LOC142598044 [Dermatophagoides farinae]|uniref:uncharacterized protein LOC142598044 n=1 Tax=Dermatophagoides farinae TaxID=6954 RepID=UPI003F5DE528